MISVVREVAAVFNISLHLINGMSVGIEFPPRESIDDEHPEEIGFVVCVDLLIFRVVLFTIKPPKK